MALCSQSLVGTWGPLLAPIVPMLPQHSTLALWNVYIIPVGFVWPPKHQGGGYDVKLPVND